MAEETIQEVKRRLVTSFLGRCGIHGIGIDRTNRAIRLYRHSEDSPEYEEMMREIREQALPYAVVAITEAKPILL